MTAQNPVVAQAAPPDPRRWAALVVLLTAAVIDVIDVTIVNIAMPSIWKRAGATYGDLQWIAAGYALAFAVCLVTGGRLGDIYGRKRLFLLGIAGFTLASALCGCADGPVMLIVARILQGSFAAMMVPQVLSIIHVTFPDTERAKVFSVFGAVIGMGAVFGPILGAVLTQSNLFGLGWRCIFLVNVPLGAAGLLFGRRFVTESRAPQTLRLDPGGIALSALGLALLFLPMTAGKVLGYFAPVLMALGLAVLVYFVRYERAKSRRDGSPVVELSLFRVRSFAAGIGIQLSVSAACGIFLLGWTIYLQLGLGWSPIKAGLTGMPNAVATAVAAAVAMQKLMRYGRKVLQIGTLTMAAGALLYALAAVHDGPGIQPWQMILPLTVMGAGLGLIIAPLTNATLSRVPFQDAGSASGLINTTNQIGMALGFGLAAVSFFRMVDFVDPQADRHTAPAVFAKGFSDSQWWVATALLVAYALMFKLPAAAAQPAAMPAAAAEEEPVSA